MAIEAPRGCGYRKVGGLYMCGAGIHVHCDRLPYELVDCKTCGAGIKFSRGFQWINWNKYAGYHGIGETCICSISCEVCNPSDKRQPIGLMWVGESNYTPQEFILEANTMGVSKRISHIPKNIKLGSTLILLAHQYAMGKRMELQEDNTTKEVGISGVFYGFYPIRFEQLIWQSQATPEEIEKLQKRGITPVIVPDEDSDHDPAKASRTVNKALREKATKSIEMTSMKNKLQLLKQ